jgi:aminoglycoside 3-N-acetyltransferase
MTSTDPWLSRPRQTIETLTHDLRELGLREGDSVLVHSSLSELGNVDGAADAVIDALLAVVGPQGTVLLPTLTGTERDGPDAPPVMDVRQTPCWTGRIPETARRRPGAIRSLHPTHSVTALGANAGRWTTGHEKGTSPCDRSSPYHRLIEEGGSILLLGGVSHQSNTTLHCLEELAGVPYHLQRQPTDGFVTDAAGQRRVVRNRLHQWGHPRDFGRIEEPLLVAGAQRLGQVGDSVSRLIDARGMAEVVLSRLREDPGYLLA